MPAPGEEDPGGNPLQEGILGGGDGGWKNYKVRDESFASVRMGAIMEHLGKVCPLCRKGSLIASPAPDMLYCPSCHHHFNELELNPAANQTRMFGAVEDVRNYHWEPQQDGFQEPVQTLDPSQREQYIGGDICPRTGVQKPFCSCPDCTNELITRNAIARGVDEDDYAIQESDPDVEIPAEVVEVIPPDKGTLRPGKKRQQRKEAS